MWCSPEKQPTGVSNKLHASHRLRQVRPCHLEALPTVDSERVAARASTSAKALRHSASPMSAAYPLACRNGPLAQIEERTDRKRRVLVCPQQSAFCGSLSKARNADRAHLWNKRVTSAARSSARSMPTTITLPIVPAMQHQ